MSARGEVVELEPRVTEELTRAVRHGLKTGVGLVFELRNETGLGRLVLKPELEVVPHGGPILLRIRVLPPAGGAV